MKKWLWIMICSCLILSGCGNGAQQTEGTDAGEETASSFMEGKLPEGNLNNLYWIPNETVESMNSPRMYLVNNQLLLTEQIMDEENSDIVLKMISLEDGSLKKEKRLFASGTVKVQIGQGMMALLDSATGFVRMLDENLEEIETYEVDQNCEEWYLNPELEILYQFYEEEGIIATNLKAGTETAVLDKASMVRVHGNYNNAVIFSYLNHENQRIEHKLIDLETGKIQDLPINEDVKGGYRYFDNWILEEDNLFGCYTIVTPEEKTKVTDIEGTLRMIGPSAQILHTTELNNELYLYDMQGQYKAHCILDKNVDHAPIFDFIWNGYHQGYFFVDSRVDGSRLMFWDFSVETSGENLEFAYKEEIIDPKDNIDELRARAKEISKKFGVDIRIGSECALDYNSYTASILDDGTCISDALDVIEHCMSRYPEGFMEQLLYSNIDSIRIELVSSIQLSEGTDGITNAGGFVSEKYDYHLMVLDGVLLTESSVYHELTHIIENRIEFDARIREDALFSEERWMELQPEGFEYANTYLGTPDHVKEYYDSGYFVSEYSCTRAAEDRATMMESAMCGYTHEFEIYKGLLPKLVYFSECIRDCFDTTGWPEVTAWEQIIEELK